MADLQSRQSWWLREATRPLSPERLAIQGACVGALAVSGVWVVLGLTAALPVVWLLGPAAVAAMAVSLLVAPGLSVIYAHLLAGPNSVRIPPTEWIVALGTMGPVAAAPVLALASFGPFQPVGITVVMMLLAGLSAMMLAPFGVLPLVALWSRHFRNDDHAAFASTVVGGGLALVHGLLLVAVIM
ncbi:MAG: hypothetical protein KTR31_29945 [Myxococcales bacterium]|nr:hypothetical protein [Myxococcales bacterium]